MSPLALAYIRRSVIKRGEKTDSPEKQKALIERVCADKGWTVEWYQDAEEGRHYSGRSEDKRPAWQRLKAQLTRPDVVAIVVSALDRATRSKRDFFNLLDLLQKHGKALVSATQQIDTSTPMGEAFVGMMMIVAALESDLAAERVSGTIEYRKSRGVHWGFTPFGYERQDGGQLAPSADAEVLRQVYELYAGGQEAYHLIARRMNEAGHRFPSKRDGLRVPFTKSHIRTLLQNHWLYRGFLVNGGRHHAAAIYEHDEDNPPMGAARGQWPPLIDADLAGRVAAVLKLRQHPAPVREADRVYILTPVLYCGRCGLQLRGKAAKGRRYYSHHGRGCGRGHSDAPAADLETQALALVCGLRVPEEWLTELRQEVRSRLKEAETPEETARAKRLRQLKTFLKREGLRFAWGDISEDEYIAERDTAQAEMATLERGGSPGAYDVDHILRQIAGLGERISGADRTTQKDLISLLFTRLEARCTDGQWGLSWEVRPLFRTFF
jgi:DNA invertase Pin-like site-specific DNA recombinase